MDLSLRDIKSIAHNILDEELSSHDLKANIMPYTFVEYSGSRTLRKRTIFKKISKWIKGHSVGGFYKASTNDIVIFIDRIKKIKKFDKQIFKLAFICYHEARHREQAEFSPHSYEGFMDFTDRLDIFDYGLAHDSFSLEIGANLYGTRKAKEYMLKKYPQEYESQKEYITLLEQIYYYQYLTYDAPVRIDAALASIKLMNSISKIKATKKEVKKNTKIKQYEAIYAIFLNEDLTFKSIDEIINNKDFIKLDKKIIYAMFSSKSFLSTLDLDALSQNGLQILHESLAYTCSLDAKQIEWQKELQKIKMSILGNKHLKDKFDFIIKDLTNISFSTFSKSSNTNMRKNYLNMVEQKLQDNYKTM